MRHYNNLARTAPRLTRLLEDFCFGSIETVVLPESSRLPTVAAARLADKAA
jgi:hypothetical protein